MNDVAITARNKKELKDATIKIVDDLLWMGLQLNQKKIEMMKKGGTKDTETA